MTRQEAIKRLSLIMHSERIGWNPNTVEAFQMAIDALDEDKDVPSKDGDTISRADAIRVVSGLDSSFVKYIEELPSVQPEPLTDREQRIFLAAMGREEKVCEEVDRNHIREAYEDSLMWICREIKRKVKGALWT